MTNRFYETDLPHTAHVIPHAIKLPIHQFKAFHHPRQGKKFNADQMLLSDLEKINRIARLASQSGNSVWDIVAYRGERGSDNKCSEQTAFGVIA